VQQYFDHIDSDPTIKPNGPDGVLTDPELLKKASERLMLEASDELLSQELANKEDW